MFDDWGMGFSSAPKSFHLQLERARWGNIASTLRTGTASSAGVDLLLQFWRNASRGVF
ncbi:MAG: hypothetical protein ACKVOX_06350 [Rhizobacter sp.]